MKTFNFYLLGILLVISISSAIFLSSSVQAEYEEFEIVIPQGAFSPYCAETDSCFIPSTVTIPQGSSVEWKNLDSASHSIVSGYGFGSMTDLFDSGVMSFGDEFEIYFSNLKPGEYPYFCTIHPWMKGEIIVEVAMQDTPVISLDDEEVFEEKTFDETLEQISSIPIEDTQKSLEDYKIRAGWLREFPVTGESNGIELIVSSSSPMGHMKMDHGSNGGGCGGMHGDKGMHGDDGMKGMHEGGCPHFAMVKKSLPKLAAVEAGIPNLENSLNMEIIVKGESYPASLQKDPSIDGRYYFLFIPVVADQYDVHITGNIKGNPVDQIFNLQKPIAKESLPMIP